MGSSDSKIKVVQYFMSIWYGLGIGPVDRIERIRIDEKEVWKGTLGQSGVIKIDDNDLFGGITKEGGVFGSMTYLDGKSTQTIPQYLAEKLGFTEATCPAHRGLATLFLSGGVAPSTGGEYGNGKNFLIVREGDNPTGLNAAFADQTLSYEKGFYWRANQPNIPPLRVTARRAPKVLNPEHAMIGPDANVVHVIYEVMTNTDWGIGMPAAAINTAVWEAASEVVFNEGIGISLMWTEQQSAEDFIADLLGYIEGVIYTNPRTGLLDIKLIRADYNPAALFEITPDNAQLSGFQRKMWGETTNEIVVTWTNPDTEEEETITVQEPGNLAMQGYPVSDSKNYPGVRSSSLAMKLARRDLRVAASPLMSCRAVVNRSAWDIVPGSVVKLTWPEHGMSNVVMRVMDVDYGKTNDSAVKLALTEDIFGLDAGEYYTPPASMWQSGEADPTPMDHSLVTTLPYYLIEQMGLDVAALQEPQVYVAVLGADDQNDISQYRIVFQRNRPSGAVVWRGSEVRSLMSRSVLTDQLNFSETSNTAHISVPTSGFGVNDEQIALIGGADAEQELCVVLNVGQSTVTLKRGILDTTPKAWPAGTPIWFIPLDADIVDDVKRYAGQTLTYRLLSTTSKGTLRVSEAPNLIGTTTRRPWLPLRPARCRVNGTANGTVNAVGDANLSLTWANRNRLFEDSVLLGWDEGNVAPEEGQTTKITVLSADKTTVLHTVNDLTGTSYTLPTSTFGAASRGWVKFTAKNAAERESLQGHMIEVIVA